MTLQVAVHARRWLLRARTLSSCAHDAPTTATPAAKASNAALPRIIGEDALFENPWLRLKRIRYLDSHGRTREWTGLERVTTYPSLVEYANGDTPTATTSVLTDANATEACDAVVVFPFLTQANAAHQVILIRQFRPPVGKWVIELPAGLIDRVDDGDNNATRESPETTALRELREETGYTGTRVLHVGPPMVNDQMITNGTCRLVLVEVRSEEQSMDASQALEADETIDVLLAPLDGLVPWLVKRKATTGDAIDARLYAYALGLQALPAALWTQRSDRSE